MVSGWKGERLVLILSMRSYSQGAIRPRREGERKSVREREREKERERERERWRGSGLLIRWSREMIGLVAGRWRELMYCKLFWYVPVTNK